ncbi:hypothetical protein LTS08_007293 [Lithohypha guttulata]|nr:hypothetical protein LTR51_002129 [Lithohypha guttulata]KAK5096803.1 hypothetical protein LTS08_007293 [Lithohypha guttulata]
MQRSNSHSSTQQQYTPQTSISRYSAAHSTSSAFSASANPNEDWTKISDLAERRRIQNRIAQRNYRKKLKRRLEDLERKAVSTSPELCHADLSTSSQKESTKNLAAAASRKHNSRTSRASSTTSQDQELSPKLLPLEDPFASMTMTEQQYHFLAPGPYTFSGYPSGTDYFDQNLSFCDVSPIPQVYSEPQITNDYTHLLPPSLPLMHEGSLLKRDPYSMDENFLSPFGMSYATLVGAEAMSQQANYELSSRVNTISSFLRQYPHSR